MNPKIIFENDDFLAVNKPAGMLVHEARIKNKELRIKNQSTESKEPEEKTLVSWLLERYPELKKVGDDPISRPGIVHRLDKDTSGVILIPKNQEYYLYLKSLFQEHRIKKTYLAIVWGVPKNIEGIILKPIGIKSGTIKRSVHSNKHVKSAVTKYRVLKSLPSQVMHGKIWEGAISLLQVMPETGRTHQIRIHLSSIGHPILGDKLYGNKNSIKLSNELNVGRQLLHAKSLEFSSKGGSSSGGELEPSNRIMIEAELPVEFKKLISE